ncbi:MAG: GNAT family N-acetyltransferase [Acidobacteriota bacterium]
MMHKDIVIEKATMADLAEILALLSATDLPHEGVTEHLTNFLIARNQNRELVGCAGLERYQQLGLLRSVAISPALQRTGLGSQLISFLIKQAISDGIEELVLLTTTAKDFFARRFNFSLADRAEYDNRLANSPEWRLPRCSSAAFMRLNLQ